MKLYSLWPQSAEVKIVAMSGAPHGITQLKELYRRLIADSFSDKPEQRAQWRQTIEQSDARALTELAIRLDQGLLTIRDQLSGKARTLFDEMMADVAAPTWIGANGISCTTLSSSPYQIGTGADAAFQSTKGSCERQTHALARAGPAPSFSKSS